jgi:Zn-dependent peptidase ImmA (M78 family)
MSKVIKFNVFGIGVSLVFQDKFSIETGYAGLYEIDKHKITVDSSLVGKDKHSTIWHEFFHAVFFRTGLSQTSVSRDVQEVIVENFSIAVIENAKELKKFM